MAVCKGADFLFSDCDDNCISTDVGRGRSVASIGASIASRSFKMRGTKYSSISSSTRATVSENFSHSNSQLKSLGRQKTIEEGELGNPVAHWQVKGSGAAVTRNDVWVVRMER